jgi:hypothetical protein
MIGSVRGAAVDAAGRRYSGHVFGRRKTAAPPAPTVVVAGAKGKATPKRRESQAARKQPLVPVRSKSTGKGASKEVRAAARAERVRARDRMMAGDERYLPARDRGPVRRFARDFVDARLNLGELLLPVMLVVVILSFSGLQTRLPALFSFTFVLVYAMVFSAGIDAYFMTRRLKKQVIERFGADAYIRGTSMYAVFRAFQLRRSRIPRPAIKRGQTPA